ncbi:WD40 repeat-like protein, partial [Auricularia subglabra TFB-10046 SS5]
TLGRTFREHKSPITCVRYLPCGRRFVSCSRDSTLRIWDATGDRPVSTPLYGHADEVQSIAVSPGADQIASGGNDCAVLRWDAAQATLIGKPMLGHTGRVMCLAYSPDGSRIISGSFDRTLRCWESSTGAAIGGPLEGHRNPVWCLAFSPDGRLMASGSWDESIRLWDGTTGECLARLANHDGSSYSTFSLCFYPDSRRVVTGSRDSAVRIWDVEKRLIERTLHVQYGPVNAVAFSPGGECIASAAGADNTTIRLLDADNGEIIDVPIKGHKGVVKSLDFSPDKRSLLAGSDDGAAYMWKLSR